jgi:hypothetical protein
VLIESICCCIDANDGGRGSVPRRRGRHRRETASASHSWVAGPRTGRSVWNARSLLPLLNGRHSPKAPASWTRSMRVAAFSPHERCCSGALPRCDYLVILNSLRASFPASPGAARAPQTRMNGPCPIQTPPPNRCTPSGPPASAGDCWLSRVGCPGHGGKVILAMSDLDSSIGFGRTPHMRE